MRAHGGFSVNVNDGNIPEYKQGKRMAIIGIDRGEELKRLMQEAGATLYAQTSRTSQQAEPSAAAGAQARSAASGTRVVDAEFREKP
jgi:hypothetical protein